MSITPDISFSFPFYLYTCQGGKRPVSLTRFRQLFTVVTAVICLYILLFPRKWQVGTDIT